MGIIHTLQYSSSNVLSLPPQFIRHSWKPIPLEISSSKLSLIFPPAIFPSLPIVVFSNSGNSCCDSLLWSRSGRSFSYLFICLSPWPLTLHIYADGLDGSHPHPVVGLAVVATPLNPLDGLDAQRFVEDGFFLELVWCTASRLRPPYLKIEGEEGGGGKG